MFWLLGKPPGDEGFRKPVLAGHDKTFFEIMAPGPGSRSSGGRETTTFGAREDRGGFFAGAGFGDESGRDGGANGGFYGGLAVAQPGGFYAAGSGFGGAAGEGGFADSAVVRPGGFYATGGASGRLRPGAFCATGGGFGSGVEEAEEPWPTTLVEALEEAAARRREGALHDDDEGDDEVVTFSFTHGMASRARRREQAGAVRLQAAARRYLARRLRLRLFRRVAAAVTMQAFVRGCLRRCAAEVGFGGVIASSVPVRDRLVTSPCYRRTG